MQFIIGPYDFWAARSVFIEWLVRWREG